MTLTYRIANCPRRMHRLRIQKNQVAFHILFPVIIGDLPSKDKIKLAADVFMLQNASEAALAAIR